MAIHSSILAWEISWTEEPGGLQFMGSQRIRHDLETEQQQQSSNTSSTLPLLAATTKAPEPRACALQQERPLHREAHALQLESSPARRN